MKRFSILVIGVLLSASCAFGQVPSPECQRLVAMMVATQARMRATSDHVNQLAAEGRGLDARVKCVTIRLMNENARLLESLLTEHARICAVKAQPDLSGLDASIRKNNSLAASRCAGFDGR